MTIKELTTKYCFSRGDDSSDDERRKSQDSKTEKSNKPREKFKMNIPKNQKLSLSGSSAGASKSSANNEVFEKPGSEEPVKKSLKRKADDDAVKQQHKLASMKNKIDAISKSAEKIKSEKGDDKKSKAAAAALAAGDGAADTKNRREELLKQLKAVEEAIHRKRSKLDK